VGILDCASKHDQQKHRKKEFAMTKTVLITGTSSGIGLSSAIAFAKAGFTVIATMRDTNKAKLLLERAEREGLKFEVLALDVQSDASVAAAVSSVLERHGQIDVLVNNAGAGHFGAFEQTSLVEAQKMMDVNFFGVWRVTQAVLPHMRTAGTGRIISVSSIGGLVGQPFNDAYCAAKFALEGLMESLAPVAARFGVFVSMIEPGAVTTEFVANVGGRQNIAATESDPYHPMIAAYMDKVQKRYASGNTGQTSDQIAPVILEAATSERPQLRYSTSDYVRGLVEEKYLDPTGNSVIAMTGQMLEP
jgi:NAD(P)-dependent dehydrogenase (short-subunit alcohol dehydrogenase family)